LQFKLFPLTFIVLPKDGPTGPKFVD
jgi:hypothetical protein